MKRPITSLQRTAPRRAKTQLRVTELLAAARKVFSEQGFQRATTAQIAEQAGVSEATVFTYFPGKRELCIQVLKDWYDEITTKLETELPRQQGLHAQLSYVIRQHLFTLLADGSGMCALVLGEGRTTAPELAGVIRECQRRYTAPLMDCLARARETGELRSDLPLRLLRDLVYGSMEHVLWDSITSQKRPSIDETADQLIKLIWSALMPRDTALEALTRFRADVGLALRQLESAQPQPAALTPLKAGAPKPKAKLAHRR